MPLLEKGVQTLAARLPKIVSPRTHAIIDYALAATFIVAGVKAWPRHKRAAISSFIMAGAEIGLAVMTDYPGGLARTVPFAAHLKFDAGKAGLVSSMPNLLGFGGEWPAWVFRAQAMGGAAVTGLTRYEETGESYSEAA